MLPRDVQDRSVSALDTIRRLLVFLLSVRAPDGRHHPARYSMRAATPGQEEFCLSALSLKVGVFGTEP
jgi:hypothetical protein